MKGSEGPGRVGELRAWLKWLEGLDEEALGRLLQGPPPAVGELFARLVHGDDDAVGPVVDETGEEDSAGEQAVKQMHERLAVEREAREAVDARAAALVERLAAEDSIWPAKLREEHDGLRQELRASLSGDAATAVLGTRLEAAVRRVGLLARLGVRADRERESGAVARELSSLLPEWFEARGTPVTRQADLLAWLNEALGDAVSIQAVTKTTLFDSKKHSRREGSGSRVVRVLQFVLLRGDGRVLQRGLVDLK